LGGGPEASEACDGVKIPPRLSAYGRPSLGDVFGFLNS